MNVGVFLRSRRPIKSSAFIFSSILETLSFIVFENSLERPLLSKIELISTS